MKDEDLINTLIVMAGLESKQSGAMPMEDNPVYLAAEKLKELEALKSQVEQLQSKLNLITSKLEEYCFMPDGIEESEVIRNLCLSAPYQCLAEIKAQAGRDGVIYGLNYFGRLTDKFADEIADVYFNQLLKEAKQ